MIQLLIPTSLKMKTITLGLFALIFSVVLPVAVFAQTASQMNLSDAVITGHSSDVVSVSFLLENRDQAPQLDVKYGFELVQNLPDGTQVIPDIFVPGATLAFEGGQFIEVKDSFSVAHISPGDYDLWITARTTGGALLGLGRAGKIEIEAPRDTVEIIADTCFVKVVEDDTETLYDMFDGVDVKPEETLILQCRVRNHSSEPVKVVPQYESYWRTVFGQLLATAKDEAASLELVPGETKMVDFIIPVGPIPQSYDTVVSLMDFENTDLRSNRLVMHHVLRGMSATIQDVTLDKINYAAGEEVVVTINWTGPADNFQNARFAATIMNEPPLAEVVVRDINGDTCTDTVLQPLGETTATVTLLSSVDCQAPSAVVILRGEGNQRLDTRTVSAPVILDFSTDENTDSGVTRSSWLNFALLVLLGLIGIIIVAYMSNQKKSSMKALLFALIFSASLVAGGEKVEAVSWVHHAPVNWCFENWEIGIEECGSYELFRYVVNTDKAFYQPGETISISGSAHNPMCRNSSSNYDMRATLNGNNIMLANNVNVRGRQTHYFSNNSFVAPSTPGVYVLDLVATAGGTSTVASIVIRVEPPRINVEWRGDTVSPYLSVSLTADRTRAYAWETVPLRWSVTGGAGVSCTVNGWHANINAALPAGSISAPSILAWEQGRTIGYSMSCTKGSDSDYKVVYITWDNDTFEPCLDPSFNMICP